jgi:DNA repair protein RecN (Recombination protein N)
MLGGLVEELSESESALLPRLRGAQRLLAQHAREVAALAGARDELEQAVVHVDEASRALLSFAERVEGDPARLELIEERLSLLEKLERKYQADSAGLLALCVRLRADIERWSDEERSLDDAGPQVLAARARVLKHAASLRRARKALGSKLKRGVHKSLKDLGLERAEFDLRLGQRVGDDDSSANLDEDEVQTQPDSAETADAALTTLEEDRARFGDRGMDRIEFLLAANPGEGLARLRDVASGGETARIMLALRSVFGAADRERTLVFDEIDAGVGGRLGPAVGAHLGRLGGDNQVLCVTHLPAIAALAQKHLRVLKTVQAGRTTTRVEELSGEPRVEEIADMIAGGAAHETARAEARRLIRG